MELAFQNVLVNNQRVIISERVDSCYHLVDEDAQSPPIYRFSVTLVLKNLRGQVLWCSTESKSSVLNNFGKTEVGEFKISVSADQYVLRFEIAINYVFAVKVFENQQDLSCVKSKLNADYAAL